MAAPPVQAPAPTDPKALLRHARALLGSVQSVESGPERARQRVSAAFGDLREEMVRRDLANIPVERLKDATGGGIRVTALRNAGYSTVARVLNTDPARPRAINGVGPRGLPGQRPGQLDPRDHRPQHPAPPPDPRRRTQSQPQRLDPCWRRRRLPQGLPGREDDAECEDRSDSRVYRPDRTHRDGGTRSTSAA